MAWRILSFLKYQLVTVISIFCTLQVVAQFTDSIPYHIKYDISGILNKTNNAQSYVIRNGLSFTIKKKTFSLNSDNSWIYGQSERNLTNNDFSSGLNLDYLKDVQKLYYWALANFVSSYSLQINYQFQVGGGVGYNFVNKENFELVISDGLLYEAASVVPNGIVKDFYQTVRNSIRVKCRLVVNGIISLNGTHFWQPSIISIGDYIIRSVSTCSLRLNKWLNITAGLTYNRISTTNRENLLVTIGLTAERFF